MLSFTHLLGGDFIFGQSHSYWIEQKKTQMKIAAPKNKIL